MITQTTCIELLNWRRIEATINAVRFREIISIRLNTRFAPVNRFVDIGLVVYVIHGLVVSQYTIIITQRIKLAYKRKHFNYQPL